MPAEPGEALSEREIEVVRLVAAGLSNKEIAAQLYVSPNTVKVHLRNIFTKTGVSSRTELTLLALRSGWLVLSEEEKAALAGAAPADEASALPAESGTGGAAEPAAADLLQAQAAPQASELPVSSELAPGEAPTMEKASPPDGGVTLPLLPEAKTQVPAPPTTGSRLRPIALGLGLLMMLIILFLPPPRLSSGPNNSATGLIDEPGQAALVLNSASQRWQERAPMSLRRARFGLAAWQGQLYAIGGLTAEGVTAISERYAPDQDTWVTIAPRPLALANFSAGAVKTGVLVPGGCDLQGRPVATVHLYEPAQDRWREVAPLPQALCAYALASDGQQAYLFGGWDGTRYTNLAYRYDAQADRWDVLPPVPVAAGFGGAALYGQKVYYVGGYDGERELARCQVYDLAEQTWQTCPDLLQPRGGLGLVQAGSKLYAIGGGWQHYLGFNESLDPQQARWQVVETPLVREWRHGGVAVLGATLYAVGGWNGDYLNRTYRFEVLPFQIHIPLARP